MEGWCTVSMSLKWGSRCMSEHQVGQTRPSMPPRQHWDQPEHFRGTKKNCLGLERGEQSAVEELMASHPFLWSSNQGMVPWLGCQLPGFSL